jgi:isoleucyl-tRNA synthetase
MTHQLSLSCQVDEDGRYTADVGWSLGGLPVMEAGTERILEILRPDILLSEEFIHSYPYDWRTKKPVLLRACRQWFMDTNRLKEGAIQAARAVKIRPESAANSFQVSFSAARFSLEELAVMEKRWYYTYNQWCGSGSTAFLMKMN